MEKRRCYHSIQCLFFVGVMMFIVGCPPTTATQANHGSNTKEGSMNLAYKSEALAIPSIDAGVPATFETASFGLG